MTEWDLTGDYDPPLDPQVERVEVTADASMDTEGMGPDEDEPDALA